MASTNPYAQYLGDKDVYSVLKSTVERIRELTAGLSPEQLAIPPEPGKWSIHQIVAHLADCDLVFQTRARMVMFQDKPTLVGFDQDPWALGWMREQEPWIETFGKLAVLRRSMLRLFQSAEKQNFLRYGIHTERGPVTLSDIFEIMAGHDINHLQQIERVRGIVQSR